MPKTHSIPQKHRQRQKPRKPENHRHGLDAEQREFVVRARLGEAPGDEDEVSEG